MHRLLKYVSALLQVPWRAILSIHPPKAVLGGFENILDPEKQVLSEPSRSSLKRPHSISDPLLFGFRNVG
jgi:hypothetical protein